MKNLKKKERIKRLFLAIQKEKKKGKLSLNKTIESVSKDLNLKTESVRNYYYKNLKFLRENSLFASELGIDLNVFEKKSFERFDEKNKNHLFEFVTQNLNRGVSVRQSCMSLANNDAKQMLRYQNKFRNMLKQKNKDVEKRREEKMEEKVININKAKLELSKKISDNEINALFMGLIKIVKKAAKESADEELKKECFEANQNFRQTIIDLNKTESELKKACELNKQLNLKIESQQQQICLLLDKLSKRKMSGLEKKSDERFLRLKTFNKNAKNDNIL